MRALTFQSRYLCFSSTRLWLLLWALGSGWATALAAPDPVQDARGVVYGGGAMELFWTRSDGMVNCEIRMDGDYVLTSQGLSFYLPAERAASEHRFELIAIDAQGERSAPVMILLSEQGSAGEPNGSADSGALILPQPPPPQDSRLQLSGQFYDDRNIEWFWSAVANAVHYELILDGTVLPSTQGRSYYFESAQPGSAHELQVQAVLADGSRDQAFRLRLDPAVHGTALQQARDVSGVVPDSDGVDSTPPMADPITGPGVVLSGQVYDARSMEWFWKPVVGAVRYALTLDGVPLAVSQGTSYFLRSAMAGQAHKLEVRAQFADGSLGGVVSLELNPTPDSNPSLIAPPTEVELEVITPEPPTAIEREPVEPAVFTLQLDSSSYTLQEGAEAVQVPIRLERSGGHDRGIALAVSALSMPEIKASLSDTWLEGDERTARLTLQLSIGAAPILSSNQRLNLIARDTAGQSQTVELSIQVRPTDRPDIYLLIGQSNMVGSSDPWAREDWPGGADERDARIRQLNVVRNDPLLQTDPDLFRDPERQSVAPHYITAQDPLHNTLRSQESSKALGPIGLGMSFAKTALGHTESTIVLVPAAWSGTGFCEGALYGAPLELGWNVDDAEGQAFGGTWLYERALTRLNKVIEDTGGILRGILWLQGESDATGTCAPLYGRNLWRLAAALRSETRADARGERWRGSEAVIPFIVGTLSRGQDERTDSERFNSMMLLVDNTLRGVSQWVPNAEVVINDDLVPPAYPCGYANCVHFGAEALRTMGRRYHQALQQVIARSR